MLHVVKLSRLQLLINLLETSGKKYDMLREVQFTTRQASSTLKLETDTSCYRESHVSGENISRSALNLILNQLLRQFVRFYQ